MRGLALGLLPLLAGCGPEGNTVTLYRTSAVIADARIHVATFDADANIAYNRDNCETARGLFQGQSGVSTRFWCEDGRFRK